ncbi:hypothetical protein [Flavobacterium sp.]|uniref:hypothetical protein n=1 Tax=Flavobacterium sp. TaxID=239 RepID=UPI00261D389D|nr:hypothetical protein [Flavobacterium sp.]
MMGSNILVYIEYAVLPIIIVILTFFLKNLTKDKSRTSINEYFSIAFDIILVCTVGIAIFGLGIYNHNDGREFSDFAILALIFTIVLFVLSVIITFMIKELGEESKPVRIVQVCFAIIAIVMLVYFIDYGNQTVNHKHKEKTENQKKTPKNE